MNMRHLADCIDNDEATIQSFIRDPEFAEYLFKEVLADGDMEEIREVRRWMDEARARVLRHEMELEAVEA